MKTPKSQIMLAALCITAAFPATPASAQSPPGYPALAAPSAALLSSLELQGLVGPIALYPDDLLALILPASTTPIDIVKAQRFLTKYASNKSLKPDPSISQPVLNLLTYLDVINMMGDDLDWTESLGYAVTHQQQGVLNAIQVFRRKAQAAGNLKSDDRQMVVVKQETVQIVPAKPEVIYVPVYQPATVIVAQPAPVVTYAPTAYPVYYNPVATAAVAFTAGYIVGANTAYGVNWYGGGCYTAPYANYANHIQNERMDYANNAREDWQDYGSASREDWQNHSSNQQSQRQNSATTNQTSRQESAKETTGTNQTQRQDAAAGGQQQKSANQTQRQSTATSTQSSAQQSQAARQSSAQTKQPTGSQSWQSSASAKTSRSSSSGQRQAATSSSQFGAAQTSRSSGGAYGGTSSGSRTQASSARGSRSTSGASRSGGGGGRSGGGGGRR